jgi:hypothetical protein
MKRFPCAASVLLAAALACNLPSGPANPAVTRSPATSTAASAAPSAPTATPKPVDLDHHPLYWFAPLPPQIGAYDGSDDYLDLFNPDASWGTAARSLQVFKLYGGWAARDSSMAQLKHAVQGIRARGLALAVELGPLNPGDDECGLFIEGFAGEEGIQTLQRIKVAGGKRDLIAFDEPYFYGHFYDGEKACRWSAEKIAGDVDRFIRRARAIFPDLVIGDIEPVTGPADAAAYNDWIDTFRRVNGYDLAFLHLDIDWSDTTWPEKVKAIAAHGRQAGVPIGLIYNGNAQDRTDEAWLSIAGERVKRFEIDSGGQVDQVIFQSWNDKPDRALPDNDPHTFTGFIRAYFEDRSALGFRPGSNPNLALKKPVRVSRAMQGSEGPYAVDGDPGTIWNSGDDPPQWIEIDLGAPHDIREIRLVVTQFPAGPTYHQIRGKAPGGDFVVLHVFEGRTEESQVLAFAPPEPWRGIQILRIETAAGPSWAAWREIEVLEAGH